MYILHADMRERREINEIQKEEEKEEKKKSDREKQIDEREKEREKPLNGAARLSSLGLSLSRRLLYYSLMPFS